MSLYYIPYTQKQMQPTRIFNPTGDDRLHARSIWTGNPTGLMQLNDVRFTWATKLYKKMREDIWIPEKVDMSQDKTDWNNLTEHERRTYKGMLSYLTFLDSIQVLNIPLVRGCITAPEVIHCLTEQESQEANHNMSYQVIIDSIIPADERASVYEFWKTDKILANRCYLISSTYQNYLDNPTKENYLYSLLADYLLEGIFFFNSFCFFLSLISRGLMPGTGDMIRYIMRDEYTHISLYQHILNEAIKSKIFPFSSERIYELFDTSVSQEVCWINHITNGQVLGISEESTQSYTKYLANIRLKGIGLDILYPEVEKNEYSHLEKIADLTDEATTKTNFFEGTVTGYNMSSAVPGWDTF